jgi:hypothetical protein
LQAFFVPYLQGGESQTVFIPEPSADRWMYPANSTPGTRPQASTFSALPSSEGVDDRFGQFLIGFDTAAAGIPAGMGAANYDISSIVLTASISQDRLFLYDPTPDDWSTYGPFALQDEDAGRPLELHGVGFRNDFNAISFSENSLFGGAGISERNAFTAGFDAVGVIRDVSNNVTEGFDPLPWATGQIDTVETGQAVPVDTVVRFTIDLTIPGVANHLREGLNSGYVWLALSSLHPAIQQGGGFVAYYAKEDPVHQLFGDAAPTLGVSYSLASAVPVPEFTSFLRNADGLVSIEFLGLPGFSYVMEASPDLTIDSWKSVGTYSSTTPTTFNWQEASPAGKRFFRISRTADTQ